LEPSKKTDKGVRRRGGPQSRAIVKSKRVDLARLHLRIDVDPEMRIGPGKVELLEKIETYHSISAAARAINMSYRRAWVLVDEIDALFGTRVVDRRIGGKEGGNASLTTLGLAVVEHYRAAELAASNAARPHLAALQAEAERYKANLIPPKE
jgi:molybdate transport system regulatory protein